MWMLVAPEDISRRCRGEGSGFIRGGSGLDGAGFDKASGVLAVGSEKPERGAFILSAVCGGHPVRRLTSPSGRQNVGLTQSIKYRRSLLPDSGTNRRRLPQSLMANDLPEIHRRQPFIQWRHRTICWRQHEIRSAYWQIHWRHRQIYWRQPHIQRRQRLIRWRQALRWWRQSQIYWR